MATFEPFSPMRAFELDAVVENLAGLLDWLDPADDRSGHEIIGNALRITNDVSGYGFVYKSVPVQIGSEYTFSADTSVPGTNYSRRIFVGTAIGSANVAATTANLVDVNHTLTFTPTTSSVYVALQVLTPTTGAGVQVDFTNVELGKT